MAVIKSETPEISGTLYRTVLLRNLFSEEVSVRRGAK